MKILKPYIIIAGLFYASSLFADAPNPPEPPEPPKSDDSANESGKAFLGVVSERVSKSVSVHLGIPSGFGLSVETVVRGSAAEEYGIEKYDILMELDGQMLTSVTHLGALLDIKKPGDSIKVKVLRKGEYVELDVVLGSKKKKRSQERSFTFDFDFDGLSELGDRVQALLEDEERLKVLEERLPDPEELERRVRKALSKAHYTVEESHEDGEDRTSIIHSGKTRTIVNTDDGTLIVESPKNGKYKVIAVGHEDDLLFSGMVDEQGTELEDLDEWVKNRFLKITSDSINVTVNPDLDVDHEVSEDHLQE